MERTWEIASVAGNEVLQHIGWGFGVYIPVLLSFYAIVIGGQLVASSTASATRRTLGAVAQMIAATLVPALLLIFAGCIHDPSEAGALVMIIPVTVVTFFLAVQLGGFIVFEDALKLSAAKRDQAWARSRLPALRARGRRALWLVLTVNATFGGVIAFALTDSLASLEGPYWLLLLVYVLFSFGLALVNAFGVQTLRAAQDRSSAAIAWLAPVSTNLLAVTVILNLFIFSSHVGSIALASALIFCMLSTLWPRRFMGRFLLNWTVQGAGTAYAARSLVRLYAKASREIEELSTLSDSPPNLRERSLAAFRSFRANCSDL